MIRRLALAVLLLAVPARAADEAALQGFVDRAAVAYVGPAFDRLAAAAADLDRSLSALCAAPSEAALEEARAAFAAAVRAWGRVAFLQLQPLAVENRRERLHFWPDPRGIGLRQVQAALADEDATATAVETLAGKSVALQGLGALEFLLHGTGAETLAAAAGYRCRFAAAIGGNLRAIGAALAAETAAGGSFVAALARPGRDNPLYRNAGEAASDLVQSAATGIELVRDRILGPSLGESAADTAPRSAPFWRSGLTVAFLQAMIEGSAALLVDGGVAGALARDQRWIADTIRLEAANAGGALARVTGSWADAVAGDEPRAALKVAELVADNLKALIGTSLVEALGLRIGFNALDGD